MNVLVWTPPWTTDGAPLFHRNTYRKHLIPQANLLASLGHSVDANVPPLLTAEARAFSVRVRRIELSRSLQQGLTATSSDPSVALYEGSDPALVHYIAKQLAPLLRANYDVILLWETPAPFLEQLFPEALIVHQMPGVFSRPPYPHTVTFDPAGLYRRSTLYRDAAHIKTHEPSPNDAQLTRDFIGLCRESCNVLQPFGRDYLDPSARFSSLVLLPLQVTAHYAFLADTPYRSQMDYLLDILRQMPDDVGLIATQYITPRIHDTVLDAETVAALQRQWPNLIFRPEFDRIPSVSQYMLSHVDSVVTCSSSLGIQGLVWNRTLQVAQETFLRPYATDVLQSAGERQQSASNALAFLLSRGQPLASDVTSNAKFLDSLLQEMAARKSRGATGLDLLPPYRDIDEAYPDRLLGSFRTNEAAKTLAQGPLGPRQGPAVLSQVETLLETPGLKAVTFDVFDTLINRPLATPASAYAFLETDMLRLTNGTAQNFADVRLAAEVDVRKLSTRDEITLEEIYEHIGRLYSIDRPTLEAMWNQEIALELDLSAPRPRGQALFQMARRRGLQIYLISDMYLPSHAIKRMLEKAGYDGLYTKLFLSRDHGVRKREGGLFQVVLHELPIPANQILHIGDHERSDFAQAKAHRLLAFRTPSAAEGLRKHPRYRHMFPGKSPVRFRAPAVLEGLIANEFFDSERRLSTDGSLFGGDPRLLGYAGLGPVLVGFMLWLFRQAQRDGITKLYFLAREGWVFLQVWNSLKSQFPDAPEAVYLLSSRRCARVAALKTTGDVVALAGTAFAPEVDAATLLLSRFGLRPEQVPPGAAEAAGIAHLHVSLGDRPEAKLGFCRLCTNLASLILENAASERTAYLTYLESMGLTTESNPAVVDIGWRANMQGGLGVLLGKSLTGYYYATLQGAEVWTSLGHRVWSYAGDMSFDRVHPSALVRYRQLTEYLVCHTTPSLSHFVLCDGAPEPVFKDQPGQELRKTLVADVHLGATDFAKDLAKRLTGRLEQVWIEPSLAEVVFKDLCQSPDPSDAQMFVGHQVEDAMGGNVAQYLIDPKSRPDQSVWTPGALALNPGAKVQLEPRTRNARQSGSKGFALGIERAIARRFLSERKLHKYERDRNAFFADSKGLFARLWLRWTRSINI